MGHVFCTFYDAHWLWCVAKELRFVAWHFKLGLFGKREVASCVPVIIPTPLEMENTGNTHIFQYIPMTHENLHSNYCCPRWEALKRSAALRAMAHLCCTLVYWSESHVVALEYATHDMVIAYSSWHCLLNIFCLLPSFACNILAVNCSALYFVLTFILNCVNVTDHGCNSAFTVFPTSHWIKSQLQ